MPAHDLVLRNGLVIDGTGAPPLDLIGGQVDYRYPTFAACLDALDAQPAAVNAACLVGHSTRRTGAMDRLDRSASPNAARG